MGDPVAHIRAAAEDLRHSQAKILAPMSQAEVVAALVEWGRWWRKPSAIRSAAEAISHPFPYAMTRVSVEALLDSLTVEALWRLIDAEGVRDAFGVPLVGHVIAGNTPLLAWVSVIRALLMRSASLVKLPSGAAAGWGRLFHASLAEVSPALARCVVLLQWPGGTSELDQTLCESVDEVLAYGSDQTIDVLGDRCPAETRLVGYGHRVSFGLIPQEADPLAAAAGFATDVLLYDQGGCLSPQTIFVEGDWERAQGFASRLADALAVAVPKYPLPSRAPNAAMRVREARALARMGEGARRLWEDSALRWTVIARPGSAFAPSPTHGVVSVQPLESVAALPQALAPARGRLQGCALAPPRSFEEYAAVLEGQGVTYVCAPGRLQAPPLSWRQDGRPVLRTLLAQATRFCL